MSDIKRSRRGNIIYHPDGPYMFMDEPYTIIASTQGKPSPTGDSRILTVTVPIKGGGTEDILADHIDPIELSPEWLENLGFNTGTVDVKNSNGVTKEVACYKKDEHCVHFNKDGYRFLGEGKHPIIPIFHVHELQNTYSEGGLGKLTPR